MSAAAERNAASKEHPHQKHVYFLFKSSRVQFWITVSIDPIYSTPCTHRWAGTQYNRICTIVAIGFNKWRGQLRNLVSSGSSEMVSLQGEGENMAGRAASLRKKYNTGQALGTPKERPV